MIDPLFWLLISFFLVAISLTAVLVVLVPAVRELGRAARSVEKLCDTLNRELPPTLDAIRLTSQEITDLTDDVTAGVQSVSRVTQQVDASMQGARQQARRVQVSTRSLLAGITAAWQTFNRPSDRPSRHSPKLPSSPTLQKPSPLPPPSQLPSGSPPTIPRATPLPEDAATTHSDGSTLPISENSRTNPLE